MTLIELLVVVSIIALLVAILMPSLAKARELARAASCLANVHGIGRGLVLYQETNNGLVVPSYNMPHWATYQGTPGDVIDGWAAILERTAGVTDRFML